MSIHWRPGASLDAIHARARLFRSLRAFFDARGYLEVDTPALASATATDPNIESFRVAGGHGAVHWLQTSPEFAMKRLLAAASGPIYQICHAWRMEEAGRWHNPEFTLLEWYVPGFDHQDLMLQIEELLRGLNPDNNWTGPFAQLSYRQCFQQQLTLDPFDCTVDELAACAQQHGISADQPFSRDEWLDLLMGCLIGPQLGMAMPCFVVDYPAAQAALAQLRDTDPPVASRFELYWQGLELANGFHELADAEEQRKRFANDLLQRKQAGQSEPSFDAYLLAALEAGLPDCAGVALGLDRLLALMLGQDNLAAVMPFAWDRI